MDYLEEPESLYNLKDRTKKFALDYIALTEKLPNTYLGNHIRGQLIRCSTSVASNYRAAKRAQTKKVFISKISIVLEEADESDFWLEVIEEKTMIDDTEEVSRLKKEAGELTAIFVQTRRTAQKRR